MTFQKALKQIINREKPIIDVWHYLLGNYRYWLYYKLRYYVGDQHKVKKIKNKYWFLLMRKHIYEQIEYRIKWMNKECYDKGECIKCGCMTTHLQMCNKPCDGKCYPTMMGKGEWEYYKVGGIFKDKNGVWTPEISNDSKPILL